MFVFFPNFRLLFFSEFGDSLDVLDIGDCLDCLVTVGKLWMFLKFRFGVGCFSVFFVHVFLCDVWIICMFYEFRKMLRVLFFLVFRIVLEFGWCLGFWKC